MIPTLTVLTATVVAAIMLGTIPGLAQTVSPDGKPESPDLADYTISGAATHENLTIYLIRGPSAGGPVPLTLSEALAQKLFKVHETGRVNELAIENFGTEPVFLQAGDIVKGGQQDRVLTMSVLVPPKSGIMPIGAYCVEQGRWAARGVEDVKAFASADRYMPSKSAKVAMMAKPAERPAPSTAAPMDSPAGVVRQTQRAAGPDRQSEVWRSVSETQMGLNAALGAPVAAAQSQTSLQLSLENEKLVTAKAAYVTALSTAQKDGADVVGFAFAVNGKINSADIYPSHALFAKMWGKLIDAAATEALTEKAKTAGATAAPAPEAVLAFLRSARDEKPAEQKLDAANTRVIRQTDKVIASETRVMGAPQPLHRSFVAF